MKCCQCDGTAKLIRNYKTKYNFKDIGAMEIRADTYVCEKCGETYLDEKNMMKVAKIIDAKTAEHEKRRSAVG